MHHPLTLHKHPMCAEVSPSLSSSSIHDLVSTISLGL
jgi:hypothetical protein